jgi:hypothetical protein
MTGAAQIAAMMLKCAGSTPSRGTVVEIEAPATLKLLGAVLITQPHRASNKEPFESPCAVSTT